MIFLILLFSETISFTLQFFLVILYKYKVPTAVLLRDPNKMVKLKKQRRRRIRKRYLTAKKYTKKRDARAKLLFCYSKPISFLTFSLPSQPSPEVQGGG